MHAVFLWTGTEKRVASVASFLRATVQLRLVAYR